MQHFNAILTNQIDQNILRIFRSHNTYKIIIFGIQNKKAALVSKDLEENFNFIFQPVW